MLREEEAEAKAEVAAGAEVGRGLRLTERDRHLVALVRTARCLSAEQLGRLFFPERHESALRRRLAALSGDGRGALATALLSRVPFRTYEGAWVTAYRCTPAGFAVAERVLELPRPAQPADTGIDFLEHLLGANELLVRLLDASLKK